MATQQRWSQPFIRYKFQYDSPSLGRKEKTLYLNRQYYADLIEGEYDDAVVLPLFELSGIPKATAQARIVDPSTKIEVITYVKEFETE